MSGSVTIVSPISFVRHRNALHEIRIDELAVGRGQESRRVDVTSDQVVHARNRFLFDRNYILCTGCVCAVVQSSRCALERRFSELLI